MSELSILKEPWPRLDVQRDGAIFGLWIFLASEALFFGALFLTYAVCRIQNPEGFLLAARETNVVFGTVNTAILMTSSLTIAVASQAAIEGDKALRPVVMRCLAVTALLAVIFLVIKGFEYAEDIEKHFVPGPDFALQERGAQLFFGLYWTITGVHGIHVLIGIGLIARLWLLARMNQLTLERNPEVEAATLYWHLVDIVWIFVYPLLYLSGRAL
jgi:cytochrome c oxidase subunit 3